MPWKLPSLEEHRDELTPLFYHDRCDVYDYLTAAGCGALAGLVDIFLVGTPETSRLQPWTDAQVDKAVIGFARLCAKSDKAKSIVTIEDAITFLGSKFPVNYDQKTTKDVNNLFTLAFKTHHMKSLAHAPDMVGLFFSILNQFTDTASFLDNGKLITIKSGTSELQGHNFIARLFAGAVNWFGHLMSDVAGSELSRKEGSTGRGMGLPIPFFELFQLFDFIHIPDKNKADYTLAQLSINVFNKGYDFRFGLTMSIPVVLCDLLIRLIWALRQHFQFHRPLRECVPNERHDDLRLMLLIGSGTLCIMDGADAALRSGGNAVAFFLRFNLIAWYRFLMLVLREVCIRLGIAYPLQKELDAYIRLNAELTSYLSKLKQYDIAQYEKELASYEQMLRQFETTGTVEEMDAALYHEYSRLGLEIPWEGDFDSFMKDQNSQLIIE